MHNSQERSFSVELDEALVLLVFASSLTAGTWRSPMRPRRSFQREWKRSCGEQPSGTECPCYRSGGPRRCRSCCGCSTAGSTAWCPLRSVAARIAGRISGRPCWIA